MIISRYGIELRSLNQTHLQDLREWRNRDDTRKNMAYQDIIDARAQQEWFENIDHKKNLLFTYHDNEDVHGFVQLKDIDFIEKWAEAGVIHGNVNSQNSPISLVAIITLMEIAFDLIGLQKLMAKMKHDNARVISMNSKLGYERVDSTENDPFPYFTVDKSRFGQYTLGFRKMLTKRHGDKTKLEFEPHDSFWTDRINPPSTFQFINEGSFFSNA